MSCRYRQLGPGPFPRIPNTEELILIQTLSDALEQRGYTDLTPVQKAVTDPALENADLLVSAQTGSGKTVGFGLAIAPTLLGDAQQFERADKPLALIIAPTRELALQVKRELEWLYAKTAEAWSAARISWSLHRAVCATTSNAVRSPWVTCVPWFSTRRMRCSTSVFART